MSSYYNVTQQNLFILSKLAEQQNNQRAKKNKNRILKQTLDNKLPESLSPKSEFSENKFDSTKKLGELLGKAISEIENFQVIVPVKIDSEEEKLVMLI